MDRKQFFKRLFGTAVVAAVVPSILAKEDEYVSVVTYGNMEGADIVQEGYGVMPEPEGQYYIGSDPATCHSQSGVVIDVNMIPDGYTLDDVVKIWQNHHIMIIDSSKNVIFKSV